jgi:hypothetical protein
MALRNEYSAPVCFEDMTNFIPVINIKNGYCGMPHRVARYLRQGGIRFSSAKKFLAVFSPALTFSLVLSLVSRQEKERSSNAELLPILLE